MHQRNWEIAVVFVLSVLVCLSTGCVLSGPKYK